MTRTDIRSLAFYATNALFIASCLVVRFRHPQLTETQLFLHFWYIWVLALVALGFAWIGRPR